MFKNLVKFPSTLFIDNTPNTLTLKLSPRERLANISFYTNSLKQQNHENQSTKETEKSTHMQLPLRNTRNIILISFFQTAQR